MSESESTPRERIDPSRDEALREWARKLDVTPQQIKDAVQAVGTFADDVEAHLKGVRSTTNSDEAERARGRPS